MRLLLKFPKITLMLEVNSDSTWFEFLNTLNIPKNISKKYNITGFMMNDKELALECVIGTLTEYSEIIPILSKKGNKKQKIMQENEETKEVKINEENKMVQCQFLGNDILLSIPSNEITTIASLTRKIASLQNISIPCDDVTPMFDDPSNICNCTKVKMENDIRLIEIEKTDVSCLICHNDEKKGCIVCEETNNVSKCKLTELSCGDIFHLHCAERWLRTSNVCPSCSKDVSKPMEEEKKMQYKIFFGDKMELFQYKENVDIRKEIFALFGIPNLLFTMMIHSKNNDIHCLRESSLPSSSCVISICGMKAHPESVDIHVTFNDKKYQISTLFTISTISQLQQELQRLLNQRVIDIYFNQIKQDKNSCFGEYLLEFPSLQISFEARIGQIDLTLDLFSPFCKISLPCSFYDETIIEDLSDFPLFGVWRASTSSSFCKDDNVWLHHFSFQNGWFGERIPLQTMKGYNILLSSLIVISNVLSKCSSQVQVHTFLNYFQFFPPMIMTMIACIQKVSAMIGPAEKAAFIEGMYYFLRKIIPENIPIKETFESSRIVFAFLWQKANEDIEFSTTMKFHFLEHTPMDPKTTQQIKNQDMLALHVYKASCLVLDENKLEAGQKMQEYCFPSWSSIMKISKESRALSIFSSTQFRFAPHPCLTLDENGEVCVFVGFEACSSDVALFSSLLGREQIVNPTKLSQTLQYFDVHDDRIPIEGLMVCLDISQSMNSQAYDNNDDSVDQKTEDNDDDDDVDKYWKESPLHSPMTQRASLLLTNLIAKPTLMKLFYKLAGFFTKIEILRQWCHLHSTEDQKIVAEFRNVFIESIFDKPKTILKKEADATKIPNMFLCPISLQIMNKPVIAFDGFSYERTCIEEWFTKNDTSPMTRADCKDNKALIPNHNLRSEIEEWKQKTKVKQFTVEISDESGHVEFKLKELNAKTTTCIEIYMHIMNRIYRKPSLFSLWANLQDIGDGRMSGNILKNPESLVYYQFADENDVVKLQFDSKAYKTGTKKGVASLSRLETVKQLFHAFINRSQAYDHPIHVGLQTFNDKVELTCPLTPFYENFRDTIDRVTATGNTALFDAIYQAVERLLTWKEKYPSTTNLRILCLSDGKDSHSQIDLLTLSRNLQKNQILLDVVQIGEDIDCSLRAMSFISNGFFFKPSNLSEALKLNELETFLCVKDRVIQSQFKKAITTIYQLDNTYGKKALDRCDDDQYVPKRKQPIELARQSVSASNMLSQQQQQPNGVKSVMKALSNVLKENHPAFDVYPLEDNISFWKLILEGPEDSPYFGGCWLLYAKFPLDYPQSPPEIRFITPIKHANVNVYGRGCHSLFSRNYSPHITMSRILATIYGLLLTPDIQDPVDTVLAMEHYAGNGLYETSIMAHVKKYAQSKTRQDWKQSLLLE